MTYMCPCPEAVQRWSYRITPQINNKWADSVLASSVSKTFCMCQVPAAQHFLALAWCCMPVISAPRRLRRGDPSCRLDWGSSDTLLFFSRYFLFILKIFSYWVSVYTVCKCAWAEVRGQLSAVDSLGSCRF